MSRTSLNKRYGKAVVDAVDYLGRSRRTKSYPHRADCPISVRTANKMIRLRLAMVGSHNRHGKPWIMLTYNGERLYTALHPHSKYAIK